MIAIGSTESTSPTILKSAGLFDFEIRPARIWPSITNASARPDSSSRKLSEWSLPYSSLKSMPAARLFLRSSCTEVVPVVVATVLPFSSAMPVMPDWPSGRDAHFLDVERRREGDVLLARRVVGGRAALEVDGAVLHQRDAVLRGHRLVLDVELGHAELLLDVGDDPLADVVVKAGVLAVAERVGQRARRLAHAHRDGAAVLDLLQRVFGVGRAGDGERRGRTTAAPTRIDFFMRTPDG